jgi:hypothetical protein
METVACVSPENMHIFKTSFFPILVDHCGCILKLKINVSGGVTLVDKKFVVIFSGGQGIFQTQIIDK